MQANRLEVGDIDVSRDFLDVQDVLSAYLRLLSHGEAGAVYNVCSGQEQKIRELIELLADIAQVELEIVQDPARMRRAEQRRVRGSHARLHDTTGWKPEITIKQSLRAILSDWESRVREE
ncbi:oxidoreductase [Pseudomonas aeruginosa]|nr:oxidoreductase [Pseudomonas aeruginosa]